MTKLLKVLNAFVFVAGIALTLSNSVMQQADLTGGGSTLGYKNMSGLHSAATLQPAIPAATFIPNHELVTAADELVIGILLIFLGFFLHAFLTSQAKNERNVPITVVPKQEQEKKPSMYWVELKV